ncbi:MAG: glycerophosphodiester phosphodiesterase family protein [Hyphomicrobiales bacterium]|nr:glycerophosphodiester phosphodiesterase family protein [Hyphomicrobiales bacterium]MDG1523682.1 glycerophosphodiester phosphodiesterase family protein [Hyphomicrobiales bacterium]MDG1665294.1 glycerophosphodiester phosphodiesterase family protein [Hyphomicrobiales bacterium]MDG2413150.1 glycerophosphodiester phosphodiesterase family protein [Hyphomicrobiales bacterium]
MFLEEKFLAFAHRGGNEFAPENSFRAFKSAVDIGYKYLETDVHLTKDGFLIAFHDDTLDRVTDKSGLIRDLTLSEIKKAKIAGTDEIPLLSELLNSFTDCFFNIDCKVDETVQPLINLINNKDFINRVCIGSFSQKRINFIRKSLGKEVKTSMGPAEVILSKFLSYTSLGYNFKSSYTSIPIRRYGINLLDERNINYLKSNNQKVIAWTINDEDQMKMLINIGIDGIMTDNLTLLKKVLIEESLW